MNSGRVAVGGRDPLLPGLELDQRGLHGLDGLDAVFIDPARRSGAPTVTTAAPTAVFRASARPGVVPTCCCAHWRQTTSSTWKASNVLPVPGSTITLGPAGMVAQAVSDRAPTRAGIATGHRMVILSYRAGAAGSGTTVRHPAGHCWTYG